jgi:hypothetical protein
MPRSTAGYYEIKVWRVAIEITGPPVPIQSPSFAGVTLRVPLSEEPSAAWLDVLVVHEKLPGKGHRASGGSIDFHLGRGDRDVGKALREIDAAIASTNAKYEADRALLEQRARGPAARAQATIEKVAPLCESWWAERSASTGDSRADPLPPAET